MAMLQALLGALLLLFVVSIIVPHGDALTCLPCNKTACEPPEGCKNGLTPDVCGCCQRCASGSGEPCGGMWGQEGKCTTSLGCSQTKRSQIPGKCVPKSEAAEI